MKCRLVFLIILNPCAHLVAPLTPLGNSKELSTQKNLRTPSRKSPKKSQNPQENPQSPKKSKKITKSDTEATKKIPKNSQIPKKKSQKKIPRFKSSYTLITSCEALGKSQLCQMIYTCYLVILSLFVPSFFALNLRLSYSKPSFQLKWFDKDPRRRYCCSRRPNERSASFGPDRRILNWLLQNKWSLFYSFNIQIEKI